MESAALYSVALAFEIGTYVAQINYQYLALDALPPIIGIAVSVLGRLEFYVLTRTKV